MKSSLMCSRLQCLHLPWITSKDTQEILQWAVISNLYRKTGEWCQNIITECLGESNNQWCLPGLCLKDERWTLYATLPALWASSSRLTMGTIPKVDSQIWHLILFNFAVILLLPFPFCSKSVKNRENGKKCGTLIKALRLDKSFVFSSLLKTMNYAFQRWCKRVKNLQSENWREHLHLCSALTCVISYINMHCCRAPHSKFPVYDTTQEITPYSRPRTEMSSIAVCSAFLK